MRARHLQKYESLVNGKVDRIGNGGSPVAPSMTLADGGSVGCPGLLISPSGL